MHRTSGGLDPYSDTYGLDVSLMRAKSVKRRRSAGWDIVTVIASIGLAICGACTAFVSRHLTGTTSFHGQAVGVACVALGVLGLLATGLPLPCAPACLPLLAHAGIGADSAHRGLSHALGIPVRTLLLVGVAMTALGTVGLMDQAGNDVGAHCVLAEVALRIGHLEETVTKLKNDELMTQVFFRLNEMDDLMSMASAGTAAHAELRTQMFNLQAADRDLVRERVDRLHKHAVELSADMRARLLEANKKLKDLEANASALESAAVPGGGGGPGVGGGNIGSHRAYAEARQAAQAAQEARRKQEEEAWLLNKRVEAVQSVLHYLDARSHDAHAALSHSEYEIILQALLDGSSEAAGGTDGRDDGHSPDPHVLVPASRVTVLREALLKDQADVDSVRAAFERRSDPGQHYEAASSSDPRFHALKQASEKREAARKDFEARFFHVFESGAGVTHPDTYSKSLAATLDSLPLHCLEDTGAFRYLRWLTLLLGVCQALVAYSAATSLAGRALGKGE